MDRRALTRLRVAFLLLAAALLLPLGLLLRSVNARLEAQRHLRHELVAERIFDEMERELTGLLQRENARPSSAYADSGTRVENWAPFVVGYFTRDARSAQIIAKPQLAPERVQRLEGALNVTQPAKHASEAGAADKTRLNEQKGRLLAPNRMQGSGAATPLTLDRSDKAASALSAPAPAAAAFQPQPSSANELKPTRVGTRVSAKAGPEGVLKALNRAQEERDESRRALPPAKRKAASGARAAEAAEDDPFSE